jgi:glucose-6-phosphate dehydrogenase assembly protein OpcA
VITEPLHSILLDAPKEVDLVAIERELTQLWKTAAEPAAGDLSIPVVRACSLNLVVVTDKTEMLDAVGDMIGDVTLEHPARIFLISADRHAGTPSLDAWISARCSLPVPGGKQVCCEQITMYANGSDVEKIPSTVTSLLVPDVPTVVIWKTRVDRMDHVFEALVSVADRVLTDSSEEGESEQRLVSWYEALCTSGDHVAFGDLAWTHLTSWRAMVAQAFEPMESRIHLGSIDEVMIGYSSTTTPRHSGFSQSLLFVGWLVHTLHWTITRPLRGNDQGEYSAEVRSGEHSLHVRISHRAAAEGRPGRIEVVTMHSREGMTLALTGTEKGNSILIRKQFADARVEQAIGSVRDGTEAELLARELEVFQHDVMYEESMKSLVSLLGRGT